jgi:cobalt-zinc-cadmium efflux system outer membrane protein
MKSPFVIAAVMSAGMAVSAGSSWAQAPPGALTPAQAVDEALEHNLSLLAQRAGLSAAEAALLTASLRPNPVLTGSADHLDWLGTGFNDVNGAGPSEYALRVDMPLERGGKRDRRIAVADAARRIALSQFADATRRLKLDVLVACIDVLDAKDHLALARQNLEALQRLVELNDRRLSGGAISPLEATRSRVAMLQYRGTLTSAQLTLESARLHLASLLGRSATDPPVDIVDGEAPHATELTEDLAALQRAAVSLRPDLLAARQDQARSAADLKLQLAQGVMDYTVGAEYRRQDGVNGRGNSVGLFFSVPIPVWNRNQGEIQRAQGDQLRAGRSEAAIEHDVLTEVATAYAEYESSRSLLTGIERDLITPATEARNSTTYMYQAGATTLLEVLDAQRAFNDTMDTYYTARAAYRRARAKLALVVGRDATQ